jgi:hypothetical protein
MVIGLPDPVCRPRLPLAGPPDRRNAFHDPARHFPELRPPGLPAGSGSVGQLRPAGWNRPRRGPGRRGPGAPAPSPRRDVIDTARIRSRPPAQINFPAGGH